MLAVVACSACERRAAGPRRIDPPAAPGALAPNLAVVDGSVAMSWLERAGDVRRFRFAVLEADGWSRPATIAEGADLVANWADFPSIVATGSRTLYAHYARELDGAEATAIEVARSRDRGKTWKSIGRLHEDTTRSEHGFVSLLADGPRVRAFWLDGREMAGGEGPMTLRTALVGGSVEPGEVLDPRTCECCGTAAAMTSQGPIVVYRNRGEDEVRDPWSVRATKRGWTSPRPVHADGWRVPGCPVNGPAVAADGERVAVAWLTYAGSRQSVRVAFSSNAGRTFGAPIEVDGPSGREAPIGRVGVVLDDDGGAIVTWVDGRRERATIRARRAKGGKLGRAIEIARTTSERDSGFPRVVRAGDDLHFAWTDPGSPSSVRAARLPISAVPPARDRLRPDRGAADDLLAVGSHAPAVEARTLDGAGASLASLRGRVVLLNLWATWCEPCRQELPELAALQERYASRGLQIVGLSVDSDEKPEELRRFVARRRIGFSVWHDARDVASARLGVSILPASFLIDREGVLRWRRSGALSARDPDLQSAIAAALHSGSTK
ncbi:MAG: TlpA family protein disulfide reductase [Deltaproteobacteria bacterium]|nr:TlpA family protein disulfide reductase [Deltaproteobacteria bacterium]